MILVLFFSLKFMKKILVFIFILGIISYVLYYILYQKDANILNNSNSSVDVYDLSLKDFDAYLSQASLNSIKPLYDAISTEKKKSYSNTVYDAIENWRLKEVEDITKTVVLIDYLYHNNSPDSLLDVYYKPLLRRETNNITDQIREIINVYERWINSSELSFKSLINENGIEIKTTELGDIYSWDVNYTSLGLDVSNYHQDILAAYLISDTLWILYEIIWFQQNDNDTRTVVSKSNYIHWYKTNPKSLFRNSETQEYLEDWEIIKDEDIPLYR